MSSGLSPWAPAAAGINPPAGQIGGTAASPTILGLRETAGPTLLTLGAVADGQNLRRSGTTAIGDVPSYADVHLAAAQNAASAVFTKVAFDTVDSQSSDNPFSTVNNNFTAPRAGRLLITAVVAIVSFAYNNLVLSVYKNNAEALRGPQLQSLTLTVCWIAESLVVAANDVIDLRIFQDSGANKAITTGTGTHMEINYLGV